MANSNAGKGGAQAQSYGVNPYNNAAQGMQQAFNTTQGTGMAALLAQAPQYQAQNMQASTYNPANSQAATAQAQNMQGAGYNAALQGGPAAIHSQMGNYQNPYEDQVVGSAIDQMNRSLTQQQQQTGDAAIAAGAFGGGRHGLVEAQNMANTNRAIGDVTGQLRHQGFQTAAGLAGQDISNQMNVAGQNQQAQNQQGQFNAANQQQAAVNNQNWQNQMGQFNAGNQQQTALANQQYQNQAGQFNAGNQQQAGLANQQAQNQAARDNQQTMQNHQQWQGGMGMQTGAQLGNLAQASFGMGSSLNQQQQQQGQMAQQLLQQILSQGQQGFDQWAGSPEQQLQLRLAALGMNPLNNATTTTGNTQNNVGWGVGAGNLLGAAGNMFSFNPITLSSGQFKHEVQPTGRMVMSADGNATAEVNFRYLPEIDPEQTCYTGIIAEWLPEGDSAVITQDGKPYAVDYSKLEVIQ